MRLLVTFVLQTLCEVSLILMQTFTEYCYHFVTFLSCVEVTSWKSQVNGTIWNSGGQWRSC